MDKWQPIETAPRDGTWFLTCNVKANANGFGPEYEIGCYRPLLTDRFDEVEGGLYRKRQEQIYDWEGFNNFGRATHWQPLPSPPSSEGRNG